MNTFTSKLRDLISPQYWRNRPPVVASIRLSGIIADRHGLKSGLSLDSLGELLERAFKISKVKAVAISINSPGGSPVQSALIAKRIRSLAKQHDVPVYAFCEDVAASGGYWLAACADEIYAEENTIIGSIGVISSGFGFTDMIGKLGIERRVHAAGDSKSILDPFKPEKPADVKYLKSLQSEIHESFKDMVRERRGDRLNGTDKKLFSGAFWTGRTALELGLIDGLGDLHGVLQEKFGEKVRLKPVKTSRSWLKGLVSSHHSLRDEIGSLSANALATVEDRTMWNRYGL